MYQVILIQSVLKEIFLFKGGLIGNVMGFLSAQQLGVGTMTLFLYVLELFLKENFV